MDIKVRCVQQPTPVERVSLQLNNNIVGEQVVDLDINCEMDSDTLVMTFWADGKQVLSRAVTFADLLMAFGPLEMSPLKIKLGGLGFERGDNCVKPYFSAPVSPDGMLLHNQGLQLGYTAHKAGDKLDSPLVPGWVQGGFRLIPEVETEE